MDKKSIGQKLKRFRLEKNETLEDVASALNVTKAAISRYENGDIIPSDEVKIKYSKHFKRTVQYLFFT